MSRSKPRTRGAATWWRPPTSAAERTLANLERRAASIGLDSSKIAIAAPQTTATIAGTPAETTTNPTPPTSTTSQSGSTAITTPTTTSGAPATSSPTSVRTPPHPLIIRAFGDSILLSLVLTVPRDEGLVLVQAQHDMELGCGVTDFGGEQMQPECVDRIAHWTAQTVDPRPDAVVMMSCQWESVNRVLPGDRSSSHVGDSAFDVFVEASYVDALTQVFAWGAPTVLWTRCPYFSQTVGDDTEPESMQQSRQHERTDALNRLIELAVSQFPGRACTIPFDDWMNQHTNDARIRPDGSHYDFERAADAGEEFARKSLQAYEECLR